MQSIRCPELTYLITEYFNPFSLGQFCLTEYSWLANFSFTRKIYHPIPSWPARIMPRNPLIALWGCFVCGHTPFKSLFQPLTSDNLYNMFQSNLVRGPFIFIWISICSLRFRKFSAIIFKISFLLSSSFSCLDF